MSISFKRRPDGSWFSYRVPDSKAASAKTKDPLPASDTTAGDNEACAQHKPAKRPRKQPEEK